MKSLSQKINESLSVHESVNENFSKSGKYIVGEYGAMLYDGSVSELSREDEDDFIADITAPIGSKLQVIKLPGKHVFGEQVYEVKVLEIGDKKEVSHQLKCAKTGTKYLATDYMLFGSGNVEIFESVNESEKEGIAPAKLVKGKKYAVSSKTKNGIELVEETFESIVDIKDMKYYAFKHKDGTLDIKDAASVKENVFDISALNESVNNDDKITTDEQFKEWGETVLKKAHGDDYDQEKADKTLEGILKDSNGDYGAAVGALTSGLGEDVEEDLRQVKPNQSNDDGISIRTEDVNE